VLAATPQDTDILAGLADVLIRQQRFEDALELLGRAHELGPSRADILMERGRALHSLGRAAEARQNYRAVLALDPKNASAKAALAAPEREPRHEFRIGNDFDFFNFASHAQTQTASLRSQWSSRWTSVFSGSFYQRFDEQAAKFTGTATYRLGRGRALTAGGAAGRDQGIIPRGEAFLEYGRGFRVSETRFLRAVETAYQQHWFWFAGARVLALTGSALLYLPHDWTWSLAVTGARSRFSTAGAEWRPSGLTGLSFPVGKLRERLLTANLFYAVGTENFAQADQIGRFSARTFGGGARFHFTQRQDLTGSVAYQNRSLGRTQTSFGLSYGLRF
jgi:tetratricopeptide (TPR) repeat protein